MDNMTLKARECILNIKPYVPGKPIEEVKRELGLDDVSKLASNENPLGPSPLAIEAMKQAAENVALYPDGSCYKLRQALAAHLGVDPDMLLFGTGGDEVIFYLSMALLNPGDETVQADITFSEYETAARVMDATAHMVPLKNWTYDLEAMMKQVNSKTRIVTVTNPNNPTGTIISADEIEKALDKLPDNCVMFLDEAYYEYVDDPNYTRCLEWVKQDRNVLVLRTFSKIYGLAGLRVGYGIAPKRIIDILERVRAPFNVNSIAQEAALASLADPNQVVRSKKLNRESLEFFYKELTRLGVEYVESQANFLWIDVKKNCREVFAELLKRGVIVRTGDIFGCPTHIRVSTGTPEQNKRFIECLTEVLGL
jgi:histidinol-phosphate aminotransferase